MKRFYCLGLTCVCLGIAAMLLFRTNNPAIAAHQSSCGSWNYVPSPNPTNAHNILDGVATIAPDDVWAVGGFYGNTQALIEHWDGSQWRVIANPAQASSALNAVVAISSADVWAVGSYSNQTLIEHWDGTTWSVVSSPGTGNGSDLYAVAAVSATDIWAVGVGGNSQSLIEHWNGAQWSIVPSPTNVRYPSLDSVTALSASDVWAVGMYYPRGTTNPYTLVEHWDGSRWSVVPSPNPPSVRYALLSGVAAVSATDIWAVGSYETYISVNPLIEHWNGTKWSITHLTRHDGPLFAVAVISATDIWAVGGSGKTLTEHWDGSRWSVVPSPNPGKYTNRFLAVANIPGSNYTWAVGNANYQEPTGSYLEGTFTAYYC